MLSARAPGSARCPRWWGEEARPRELRAGQPGRGQDSAPGRRCAVRARKAARLRSGPGGGPRRSPDVRGSAARPHAAALRRRRGTEPAGARRRGPGRGPGRGVPERCGRRRSAAGPCALRRPLPRGRRTGAGVGASPEEGRGSPRRASAAGPGAAPPGAGAERRGEAPALTSRGPAGDGGSGHSTPHRPPPRAG